MVNIKFINSRTFLILFSLSLIAIDQITKIIVHSRLEVAERWEFLNPIENFISIVFVSNSGLIFGVFENYGNAIVIFSVFISAMIVYLYPKLNDRYYISAGLILILSGAVGNVIDRLIYGYVIDIFLFVNYIVLNIADIYVLAGIFVSLNGLLSKNKKNLFI